MLSFRGFQLRPIDADICEKLNREEEGGRSEGNRSRPWSFLSKVLILENIFNLYLNKILKIYRCVEYLLKYPLKVFISIRYSKRTKDRGK